MEFWFWPGTIGDSCAETGRYVHLCRLLGIEPNPIDLNAFVTALGFLRHPTAPDKGQLGPDSPSWREPDFSADQALPLFLAAKTSLSSVAQLMRTRLKANWYRTGNNKFISPGFLGLLTGCPWLINLSTIVQAIFFKFPWRWSDSTHSLEPMEDSAADYLNYIHAAVYAHPWSRKLISKDVLKQKVREYYNPPKNPERCEPNHQWILDLYDQVLDKYFT